MDRSRELFDRRPRSPCDSAQHRSQGHGSISRAVRRPLDRLCGRVHTAARAARVRRGRQRRSQCLSASRNRSTGRQLLERFGRGQIAAVEQRDAAAAAQRLRASYAAGEPNEALNANARGVLTMLAAAAATSPATDPRVRKAIAAIELKLNRPITLREVAADVHLSPSRFRHLFVAETGVPFRAYVLWLRLQAALEHALAGESWTEAAYNANFADSAHLSRTFKRMFGVVPGVAPRNGCRARARQSRRRRVIGRGTSALSFKFAGRATPRVLPSRVHTGPMLNEGEFEMSAETYAQTCACNSCRCNPCLCGSPENRCSPGCDCGSTCKCAPAASASVVS